MLFFQNKNIFKTTASARPPSFSAQPHESHPQGADSQSKKASADRDLHSSVVLSARHNWHSSSGTDAGRCCKPRYRFRENRHILYEVAVFWERLGKYAGRFHKLAVSCIRCNRHHKEQARLPLRKGALSYHAWLQFQSFLFREKYGHLYRHFVLPENSSLLSDTGR